MNLAVVVSADSWYFKDLVRAAGAHHQLTAVSFSHLQANLFQDPPRTTLASDSADLSQFDAVLVRTMPPGSLEQVVFRMDLLQQLVQAGLLVVNPPRAIEAAVDKYLATARLHERGLLVPETCVCQLAEQAMQDFHTLGGDVVIKPLFGSEGQGITRICDENLAWRAFKMLQAHRAVIYQQRFVPHAGYDLRILLLGEQVYAIRRRHPTDWRTNISRGAIAEPYQPTPDQLELARAAAQVIGAPLAGVDLLPGQDGRCYLLEVNAVPGWKGLAAALQVDIGAQVLRVLEQWLRESPA